MLGNILNVPAINVLETAMNASNLRQQVISNNIANVNTPNFKRKELVFESLLAKALYPTEKKSGLSLALTNEKHISLDQNNNSDAMSVSPMIRDDNSTTMRTDGNNVDPDIEMSGLAKNTLYYNALAREMNMHFTNLKSVITD
ncbi:flagellar basal body rod protein FlgB [Pectinatus brassicae]|uniref:Flagellar basal body rod protein FlgB n=1 Tax=Pectinatus brassicae TaxID=862415 RepID=A0A840UHJ2_9FIRM|nr:flagellar basal body rod protein FlgB [Pectinatus brassicae]MBB5336586.1 flagellar basal-body rod protein FlgB [Pectinatus brassicae]